MKKKALILLLVLFLAVLSANSQTFREAEYEIKYHHGVIYRHYKAFQYFAGGRIPSLELNIKWAASGKKTWHEAKHYPDLGFGLFYSGLQQREILGTAYGAHLFSEFAFFRKKSLSFNYRLSAGLVYLTKKYDFTANPYNLAIGSHFNVLIHTGINLNWRISDNFAAAGGLSLIHFSSGSLALPNAGLNQLSLDVALNYRLQTPDIERKSNTDYSYMGSWWLTAAGGLHRISFTDEKQYATAMFSAEYQARFSVGSGISAGVDLFHDSALPQYRARDTLKLAPQGDPLYVAVHAGYVFYAGRTQAMFNIGPYVAGRPVSYQYLFVRLALRQKIYRRLYGYVGLKSFFAKADFIEWGISYVLGDYSD